MYRCETCNKLSAAKKSEIRHAVRRAPLPGRTIGEIEREYRVCGRCKALLDVGLSIRSLQSRFAYDPEDSAPPYRGPAIDYEVGGESGGA